MLPWKNERKKKCYIQTGKTTANPIKPNPPKAQTEHPNNVNESRGKKMRNLRTEMRNVKMKNTERQMRGDKT